MVVDRKSAQCPSMMRVMMMMMIIMMVTDLNRTCRGLYIKPGGGKGVQGVQWVKAGKS